VRAQREGEANAFAAELLLPVGATRATYAALREQHAERPVAALAQRFAVSEEVALRRLTALLREPADDASEPLAASAAPTAAKLDAHQRRAAHARTPALIVAGPGSGKTSALLARIAYLIQERATSPERVLALTFSRKAAGELSERLTRLLGEQAIAPRVSTIHAFCGDLLRRYGPQVGLRSDYRLITTVEGYFILRRIVNQSPLVHYTPLSAPKRHFRDLLSAISRAKDDLIGPEEYRAAAERMAESAIDPEQIVAAERALEVAAVYSAYQATLAERGDADYADLISATVRFLREFPEGADDLRGRYEHLLVDEFQDINYAMGALLRELAGRRGAIWAVGDVDQAIYRFRGASPANLLRFTQDFDDAQVIQLGRNYRSRPQILQAASAFAETYLPGEQRVALESTRRDTGDGPAVSLAIAPTSQAELDGLARAMRERLAAGVPLREQAVLLRTRDYVRQVCEGLRARGVPAQLAAPLLDQPLIKTLLATVSLTVDPLASGLLRAGDSPDHPFSDEDARAALRLAHEQHRSPLDIARQEESPDALSATGAAGLQRLARVISELRAAPSTATGMGRYIFSLTALGQRLLDPGARLEAAQVARLLEICGAFDAQRASGALGSAPPADAPLMADWAGLADYISALRELSQDPGAIDITSDEDAALVLTAHGAKGLEFPVVYLPQLAAGRFPGGFHNDAITPPPGLLRDAGRGAAGVGEDANTFYVALTRARDTLMLSYAQRYGKKNYKPSTFLEPIERALGDDLQRLQWKGAPSAEPVSPDAAEPDGAPRSTAAPQSDAAPPLNVPLSEVEAYMRCPQQYAYQYVYGLQPARAPYVSLRAALQESSATLSQRFAADDPATLEEALNDFRARWSAARAAALHQETASDQPEGDETMAAVYRAHGERVIRRLWQALRDGEAPTTVTPRGPSHVGAPPPVSVSLAGATISGALDRVEQSAEGQRVVRLQTGSVTRTATLRDLFHTLAAEEMRDQGHATDAVRLSLASGDTRTLAVSARVREGIEREVRDALDGMARAAYPPRPDAQKCASCPFALICPA
jgi:superfamily I DNA/RNA helicase